MQIIFGDYSKIIGDKYTVLELDTLKSPSTGKTLTCYCLIDYIPLTEMPLAASHVNIHKDLIKAYYNRHWTYCEHAIEGLTGKWNGAMDTFYSNLLDRVKKYQVDPPEDGWDGTIEKEFDQEFLEVN